MIRDIDSAEDIISLSDITERVEDLRDQRGDLEELREAVEEAQGDYNDLQDDEDATEAQREEAGDELAAARKALQEAEAFRETEDGEELAKLESLLKELCGYGGDHQFDGDWYPGMLIRYSHFTDYCMELVQDIGDLPKDIPSYLAIDWDKTADNLRVDYSEVEFDGVTFLYR
jgi:hypothetical protein